MKSKCELVNTGQVKRKGRASMKIKPIAKIEKHRDADGWHEWYEIDYYCPICKRHLKGYREETGCVNCEIFFNWGSKEPELKTTRTIIWD